MRTTKSGYILPPAGTIEVKIDGQKMTFSSEAALIAYSTGLRNQAPSESCPRVRRQRKRAAALRIYFKMIARGAPLWHRVAAIHAKAPKLTERIAKECGVTELKI